jgi:hypothetical protein
MRRASVVLLALWALLFAPQLFAGRGFVIGDAGSIRAFAEYSGQRWHDHHERTHWNPYIFAGLPATASLQDSRPQWLPAPLLDGFDRMHRLRGFPPLAIPLLVHLAGMIAMAALARRLWSAGTAAMVAAGAAFGLSPGLLVPFAFGQDWVLMSMALMPVVLLAIARYAAAEGAESRIARGLECSLAIACLFLAAHPQVIALTIPVAVLVAIERMPSRGRIGALLALAGFAALGAAMACAIWWPAKLYNAHTVRGGPGAGVALGEVQAWSAGLPDLLAIAWPWAAGFGAASYWGGMHATDFPPYLGAPIVALALLGLFRRDGHARAAWLFAALTAGAMLVSLGLRLGPLYLWLYEHVPMWSAFRVAIRTLAIAQLAVPLLAARGVEVLEHAAPHATLRRAALALALVAAACFATWALRAGIGLGPYAAAVRAARPALDPVALELARRAMLDLGLRLLAAAAIVAAFTLPPAIVRMRGAVLVAIVVLDLGLVSVPFLVHATGSLAQLAHPPAPLIARMAAADPTGRVLDGTRERLYSNDWIRWRAHSLTGNHPAVPRDWDDLWTAGAPRSLAALRALGVRYVMLSSPQAADTAHFTVRTDPAGGPAVWILRAAPGRAYAVDSLASLPDEPSVIAALLTLANDPAHLAFTSEPGAAARFPGSAQARIAWLADEPDRIVLQVQAAAPAFVVIADTWFPGWRATLDGQPLVIHRVQHLLRGLAVPAGSHRIVLAYEPEGWAASVRVTWIAWALALAGFALLAVRRLRGAR